MNLEQLQNEYQNGKKFEYVFFWGHNEKQGQITTVCLSQWYNCKFTVDGVEYHTAEQYMMAQKALVFSDKKVFQMIMQADNPKEYKSLGRKIHGFYDEKWNEHKCRIVFEGNMAKFSQNPQLREVLISTGDKILVEASPYDRIWGIGMSRNEPDVENPLNWQGKNLLGFTLMNVREHLK